MVLKIYQFLNPGSFVSLDVLSQPQNSKESRSFNTSKQKNYTDRYSQGSTQNKNKKQNELEWICLY